MAIYGNEAQSVDIKHWKLGDQPECMLTEAQQQEDALFVGHFERLVLRFGVLYGGIG